MIRMGCYHLMFCSEVLRTLNQGGPGLLLEYIGALVFYPTIDVTNP